MHLCDPAKARLITETEILASPLGILLPTPRSCVAARRTRSGIADGVSGGFPGDDALRACPVPVLGSGTCTAGSPWDEQTEYFSVHCEFLEKWEDRWQSQGNSKDKLMLRSSGAEFFQFWQDEQLLCDDAIPCVVDLGIILEPVGRGGRGLWMDVDFVDGRSACQHAARRFHA